MADYDVEAFIQKRNANKNTISNAGKQAAQSMMSAGISSISGKTTTSAAQRIQEQFKKNRERRRNERGLGGSPVVKEEPPKSSYERLKNIVSNLFSFSGGKLVGGTKETDPSKLYSRSSFVIPAAVAVTATELPPAAVAEQSPYTSPYMRPQPSNRDQSPTSYKFAGARDPYMERRGSPGLMAPPTMDQPDTPGMPDAINRAIASIDAEETADYTIQSGDTLSEIAAATGTTVKELQELNGIKNANRIIAGKDISIPIRRAEDKEVVTKATSMEELKPIKASYAMVNALTPLVPKVSLEGSEEERLFDALVGGESVDFDTVYNMAKIKPSKPITQMTVKEVQDWQQANIDAGSKSTAAGRFQIISPNMKYLLDKKIIKKDDVFDADTQMKAYDGLLEKRGYSDFKEDINKATTEKEKQHFGWTDDQERDYFNSSIL